MKIRINGNSVRIRLSKSEVDQFGKEGYLEESTSFGNGAFKYVLKSKNEGNSLSAAFEGNMMMMFVPEKTKQEWTSTEKVGYEANMPIGDGKTLFLLLEKDFKCLDNAIENQDDNYENPKKTC